MAALLLAVAPSVSTNGLAFTAVAELAGLAWAGRALGVQNTGQNLAAAGTPPVLAIPTRAEVSPAYSRLAGPASSPAAPASSSPS